MGCDIHAFVEIKVAGIWHTYSQPQITQNYRLFSSLAGVRAVPEYPQLFMLRGFPEDAATVTRICYKYWGTDAHSASWLSVPEIPRIEHLHNNPKFNINSPIFGYLFGNRIESYLDVAEKLGVQDVRVVFWFDN